MNAGKVIIFVFPDERPIFLKEQAVALNSPTAYFFSKMISELPNIIINPTVISIIVYFGSNLNTDNASHFFIFWSMSVLLYFTSSTYGLTISALIANKQLAVGLVPVLVIPLTLLSGFVANQDNIPDFLIPLEYVPMYKYEYQAYILNEYEEITINCLYRNPPENMNIDENLEVSIIAIAVLGVFWMMVSYLILLFVASRNKN